MTPDEYREQHGMDDDYDLGMPDDEANDLFRAATKLRIARMEAAVRGRMSDVQLRKFIATDCGYERTLAEEILAERAAYDELLAAATAVVSKLDECGPHVENAFLFMAAHGCDYDGPDYATERESLRAIIEKSAK